MELREFVSEALTQIAQGVVDAQTKVGAVGGQVNPYLRSPRDDVKQYMGARTPMSQHS